MRYSRVVGRLEWKVQSASREIIRTSMQNAMKREASHKPYTSE